MKTRRLAWGPPDGSQAAGNARLRPVALAKCRQPRSCAASRVIRFTLLWIDHFDLFGIVVLGFLENDFQNTPFIGCFDVIGISIRRPLERAARKPLSSLDPAAVGVLRFLLVGFSPLIAKRRPSILTSMSSASRDLDGSRP